MAQLLVGCAAPRHSPDYDRTAAVRSRPLRFFHISNGYVVFKRNPPAAWGSGEPRTLQDSLVSGSPDGTGDPGERSVSSAFRQVDSAALPEDLKALRGATLSLFHETEQVCQARVDELLVVGQADMSTYNNWGSYQADFKPPGTRAEIAAAIWEVSERADPFVGGTPMGPGAGRFLGARLKPLAGDCRLATWAHGIGGPAPRLSRAVPASPAWQRAGFERLVQLPGYAELTKAFAERGSGGGCRERRKERAIDGRRWEDVDPFDLHGSFVMMRNPATASLILSISLRAWECGQEGSEGTTLWAAWQVSGTPERAEFVLLTEPASTYIAPLAAVDLDSDGRIAFLCSRGLLEAAPSNARLYDQEHFFVLPTSGGDGCGPAPVDTTTPVCRE